MKTITINVPDDFKVPEGYEVQIVRKEEKKKPVIRTYQDLIDNNIKLEGSYIGSDSSIYTKGYYCRITDRNTAASEKVAKSMLAMAMISQLMPYYGGAITDEEWRDSIEKSFISKFDGKLSFGITVFNYEYLAFHTQGQRDEFLKYNEQLVKDYLMID